MRAPLVASYAFVVAMLGVTLPTPLYPQYTAGIGLGPLLSGLTAQYLPFPLRTVYGLDLMLTAGVAGYAVYGYFLAVVPSALEREFAVENHAIAGGIIFTLFAAATLGNSPSLGSAASVPSAPGA